jgi:hypothetical protein
MRGIFTNKIYIVNSLRIIVLNDYLLSYRMLTSMLLKCDGYFNDDSFYLCDKFDVYDDNFYLILLIFLFISKLFNRLLIHPILTLDYNTDYVIYNSIN